MEITERFESLKRNIFGGIDGVLFNDRYPEGIEYTLDPELGHIKKAESGEWGDIAALSQNEVDAKLRSNILVEISALDLPSWKLERALSGDKMAMDDINSNQIAKQSLRDILANTQ